jgi:glycosyltransferase involved in cell wall biosynthesis
MHSLIVHADALFPPAHGGAKCTRALAEALAERDHTTTVLLHIHQQADSADVFAQSKTAILDRGIRLQPSSPCEFSHAGVRYIASEQPLTNAVRDVFKASPADLVVVTDAALAAHAALLESVLQAASAPVVVLVWTLGGLPFGPASAAADRRATDVFTRASRVVVPSRHTANYVKRWSGKDASVFRFPVFDAGPFPTLSDRHGPVLFVNPCDLKGLPLALRVMKELTSVRFRVVPGWGTTSREISLLRALSNVDIVPRHDSIVNVLEGASAVLFPSLVEETFPLVPIEAMVHGIPVLASNVGAVPDAMLGCRFVLPVNPLERMHISLGARPIARWLSPPQDPGPWLTALRDLRASAPYYERVSKEAAAAARDYAASLRWDPVCDALVDVSRSIPPREPVHA